MHKNGTPYTGIKKIRGFTLAEGVICAAILALALGGIISAYLQGAGLHSPASGTNKVWATNYTTVSPVAIGGSSSVNVRSVRVDTKWQFYRKGRLAYFTNTVTSYSAPD